MKANQSAKSCFGFVDPKSVMMAVVGLIVMAVGVFAFFSTVNGLPSTWGAAPSATTDSAYNSSYYAFANNTKTNTTTSANSVFNIVGVVLLIGAIMAIVGLVYTYVRPGA